jgi:hypothetical protein
MAVSFLPLYHSYSYSRIQCRVIVTIKKAFLNNPRICQLKPVTRPKFILGHILPSFIWSILIFWYLVLEQLFAVHCLRLKSVCFNSLLYHWTPLHHSLLALTILCLTAHAISPPHECWMLFLSSHHPELNQLIPQTDSVHKWHTLLFRRTTVRLRELKQYLCLLRHYFVFFQFKLLIGDMSLFKDQSATRTYNKMHDVQKFLAHFNVKFLLLQCANLLSPMDPAMPTRY